MFYDIETDLDSLEGIVERLEQEDINLDFTYENLLGQSKKINFDYAAERERVSLSPVH